MGTLVYGSAPAITIEDRLLKHLQAVIIMKLRRDEPFAFNWDAEPGVGEDREHPNASHGTVWVSQSSHLYFRYDGTRSEKLNPAWIETLSKAAHSPRGLWAVPEPDPAATEVRPSPAD
jgi:hypothetical protein